MLPRPLPALNLDRLESLAPPEWLRERAGAIGVELDDADIDKLGRFLAMLAHANEHMNLTSVTEPEKAWSKHVLDSLTLMGVLSELPEGSKVIDVGTGGGLPGMPLAICMPHLHFTLLDATGKKVDFVRQAAHALGLTNVTPLQGRAEALAHDAGTRVDTGGRAHREGGHRERYDAVIARAVGALDVLCELVVPLAKVGGLIALIKGEKAEEEVEAAKDTLHAVKSVVETIVPTPTGRIVVLGKRSATPRLYPRTERVTSAKHKKKA